MIDRSGQRDQALRALFECYHDPVTRFVVRRIGLDGAGDVVSEVFAVALRQPVLPREPLPWLYAVARNLLRNHVRSQHRSTGADGPAVGADVAGVVVERMAVREALARLRDDDREVLRLVAWEGLSTSEAALVMGCTPVALRVRLLRARRRFAAALDAAGVPVLPLTTKEANR